MIPVDNHCGHSYRFPYWIPEIPRRIRLWTIGQYHRARYGVAPQDVWSLDCYLARVLSNGLIGVIATSRRCVGGEDCLHPDGCPGGAEWMAGLRRTAEQFDRLADFDFTHDSDTANEAERIKDEAFAWLNANFHTLWT